MKLGEVLLEAGLIDAATLARADRRPRKPGQKLGEVLLEMGSITPEQLRSVLTSRTGGRAMRAENDAQARARALDIPYAHVRHYVPDPVLIALLPHDFIVEHQMLPLARTGSRLTVAAADPLNTPMLEDIRLRTGLQIKAVMADPDELRAKIAELPAPRSPMSQKISRMTLAEALVSNGFLDAATLRTATARQQRSGERLEDVLIEMGVVTAADIRAVLVTRVSIPYLELRNYVLAPEVLELLPRHLVEEHQVLPVARTGNKLTLAMADPLNVLVVDDIQLRTGLQVKVVRADAEEMRQAIVRLREEAPRPPAEPADRPSSPAAPRDARAGKRRSDPE